MKNKTTILILILVSLLLYTATLRGAVGNFSTVGEYKPLDYKTSPFESSHERASFVMMLALTKDHRPDLSKEQADFGSPDVGYYNGKFYSFFPPGIPLLITPLYKLGSGYNLGLVFAYFTICLIAISSALLVYAIAREIFGLSRGTALFSSIIFAFGCTAWSYSITIYQHAATAFLTLLSFYSAWKYGRATRYSWIWASIVWVSYGAAFLMDYPNALLLLLIMVYFVFISIKIREEDSSYRVKFNTAILFTFSLFAIMMGLYFRYNMTTFGDWKKFSNTLPRYSITNLAELQQTNTTAIAESKGKIASIFSEENLPRGISELTVAPDKGIFFFSPIFLLAILGLYAVRKKLNWEIGLIAGFFAVNLLVYASFGDPWGGWAYGPRYLVPSMGFLAILCGIWISRPTYQFIRKLTAFILFAFSSAIALLGALTSNVVPPKIEAVYFGLKYSYLADIDLLRQGKTGSVLYLTHFASVMSVQTYFLVLYVFLLIVAALVLIGIRSVKHHEH